MIEDRLKKARERKFADRRKAWQTDCEKLTSLGKKPRSQPKSANLTLSERDAVERGTRAVTVADYLYRLRVKANYDDITVFAEGPTSDAEAAALAADLVDLANATLVVHEVRLADRIGSKALVRLMDEVLLKSNSYTSHLSLRRDLHAGL
ncbi:hypothetical protein [Streptomyces sp. NRRL F-5650]|uniref:hypothetical protein n=1 Tax=Streptomyces sp. NRRL F-5650 TaxID=1463868 RepID=UPI00131B6B24|nr:hypothetical protein [Streptomyces sp. NRRL F-5650]